MLSNHDVLGFLVFRVSAVSPWFLRLHIILCIFQTGRWLLCHVFKAVSGQTPPLPEKSSGQVPPEQTPPRTKHRRSQRGCWYTCTPTAGIRTKFVQFACLQNYYMHYALKCVCFFFIFFFISCTYLFAVFLLRVILGEQGLLKCVRIYCFQTKELKTFWRGA